MAISLGGGGSASVINETININSTENLITLADGRVYLKGGVTSTDLATYPDATGGFAYTGTSFSTAGQASDESDIGWDGTYFWVLDRGNSRVYKYNDSGVYQSVSFSVSSQDTLMWGIVCVGSDFYTCGAQNRKVYKYNSAGNFQSDFSVLSEGPYSYGLTYDGTHLWVINSDGSSGVYAHKYTTAGTYQNVSFKLSDEDSSPHGIAWDGTSFWMSGRTNDSVYKYSAAGVYQSVSFSAASQGTSPHGLVWDGSALWTVDDSSSAVFKYQNQIGVNSVSSGSAAAGQQNYVRIK